MIHRTHAILIWVNIGLNRGLDHRPRKYNDCRPWAAVASSAPSPAPTAPAPIPTPHIDAGVAAWMDCLIQDEGMDRSSPCSRIRPRSGASASSLRPLSRKPERWRRRLSRSSCLPLPLVSALFAVMFRVRPAPSVLTIVSEAEQFATLGGKRAPTGVHPPQCARHKQGRRGASATRSPRLLTTCSSASTSSQVFLMMGPLIERARGRNSFPARRASPLREVR